MKMTGIIIRSLSKNSQKSHYRKKIKIEIFLTSISFILTVSVFGQSTFKGILLSEQDSTPIAYAVVKLVDIGVYAETKSNGEFKFRLPSNNKELHFEIFAIGLRDTICYQRTFNGTEKIYVDKTPLSLTSVTVKGLTAKETVKKAVSLIPANYTDSSFASFSFYRQYEKINGEFKNLIEAQSVVSFKLSVSKNKIKSDYGFDIEQMRRSNYEYVIDDFKYDDFNFSDLLNQNPVYNLSESSLNPNAFSFYKFSFDTANKSDDYVINYLCFDFSSETHGVSNIREAGWQGESWEEGQFVIDRKTFAFKKIERTAHRNKEYHYPKHNNYLLPSKRYYEEFVDGNLISEYEEVKGKWFLKKICHSYTNDFFNSLTSNKEYTVTEISEYYTDSVSHYISTDLTDKFFKESPLPLRVYKYELSQWHKTLPPFHYFSKEDIYKDLNKQSAVEEQFENNGK